VFINPKLQFGGSNQEGSSILSQPLKSGRKMHSVPARANHEGSRN
jgi:hypothetical protein